MEAVVVDVSYNHLGGGMFEGNTVMIEIDKTSEIEAETNYVAKRLSLYSFSSLLLHFFILLFILSSFKRQQIQFFPHYLLKLGGQ